jgi:hypothetical protein
MVWVGTDWGKSTEGALLLVISWFVVWEVGREETLETKREMHRTVLLGETIDVDIRGTERSGGTKYQGWKRRGCRLLMSV